MPLIKVISKALKYIVKKAIEKLEDGRYYLKR